MNHAHLTSDDVTQLHFPIHRFIGRGQSLRGMPHSVISICIDSFVKAIRESLQCRKQNRKKTVLLFGAVLRF